VSDHPLVPDEQDPDNSGVMPSLSGFPVFIPPIFVVENPDPADPADPTALFKTELGKALPPLPEWPEFIPPTFEVENPDPPSPDPQE
jgi:hypothetical protein